MASPERHLVMIVGMHRSGTSVVGQVLEKLGFDFGNNLLEGIASINDEGFWEDKEVVAINQCIMELLDSNWFDFERLPGKWWEEPKIKELIGVAENWLFENFSESNNIAVKDPRFCRLLPFWKRVFHGLKISTSVLFVFRHPAEVALSLKKRDGFPLQLGYLLWLSYVIDGLYYSRNQNFMLLDYADLLKNPSYAINKLTSVNFKEFGIEISSVVVDEAVQIISEGKHHQKRQQILNDATDAGDIQTLAEALYKELSEGNEEAAKNLADKYRKRLYRLLDHHKEILLALREGVLDHVEINRSLSKLGGEHDHALAVIKNKDDQLEENKEFIARCLSEIKTKDEMLEQCRLQVDSSTVGDSSGIFAEKYDQWMAELGKLSDDYRKTQEEQWAMLAEYKEKIAFQERGLADNQAYIGRCQERIAEQDAGLAENRGYIKACEERIRVQDEGLIQRDQFLEERNNNILELDRALLEVRSQLANAQTAHLDKVQECDQLTQKIQEIDGLLSLQSEELVSSGDKILAKQQEIDSLNIKISEQVEKLAESKKRIEKCFEKITLQEEELSAQRIKLEQQDVLLATAENMLVEKERESQVIIEELSRQLECKDVELKNKSDILFNQTSVIEALEMSLAEKNNENERYVEEVSRQADALEMQASQIQGMQAEIDARMSELEGLKLEIKRLQGLDSINQQRVALQKQNIEKSHKRIEVLEKELQNHIDENSRKAAKIEWYREYTVVRALDKFFYKTPQK